MTLLLVLGIIAVGAGVVAVVRQATAPQGKDGSVELGVKELWRHRGH